MINSKAKLALTIASKVVRTPEIAVQIGKSMFRRRVMLPMDYRREDGESGLFDLLHIKLVNACNLRCKMCSQWGETGFHFNQEPAYLKELVPMEAHMRAIDDVAPYRPWVSISGGEAFLHPQMMTLVDYVKKKGLTLTLSTNALTLAENAERLVDSGLDFMYVSIDGRGDDHDRVRGLKGGFDKSIAGFRAMQEWKRKKGRVKPYMLISAAVSKDNAARFDHIFEVAEEVQADGMVASYGWFQTEESCQQHESVMLNKLGTVPVSHRGWLWSVGEIDIPGLIGSVKRVQTRNWSFPYAFMPNLSYEDIPRYYREHANTFGENRCRCPWYVCEILPNGDVATCVDTPDYIAGNIRNDSILDIWNNQRYRKFRSVLKEEGHLPVCTRVSGLIGRGL